MRRAAGEARSGKNDVIVIGDDESSSEQPPKKTMKKEDEPVPSSEVAKLQETVSKLQENFQRACRATRTAELRADYAENLLENKRDAITKADEQLEAKVKERVAELTEQLEGAKTKEKTMSCNNLALSRENAELTRSVAQLSQQLEMERRRGCEGRERINFLTHQLAQCEPRWPGPLRGHSGPPPWAPHPPACAVNGPLPPFHHPYPPHPGMIPRVYDVAHPTDILQLLRAGVPHSIDFCTAVRQLRAAFVNCGEARLTEYLKTRNCSDMPLFCEPCCKMLTRDTVVSHVIGAEHNAMARVSNAGVSLAACRLWTGLLQKAAAGSASRAAVVAAARERLQPAARAAPDVIVID